MYAAGGANWDRPQAAHGLVRGNQRFNGLVDTVKMPPEGSPDRGNRLTQANVANTTGAHACSNSATVKPAPTFR